MAKIVREEPMATINELLDALKKDYKMPEDLIVEDVGF